MAAEDYMDFDFDDDRWLEDQPVHWRANTAQKLSNLLLNKRKERKASSKVVWTTGQGEQLLLADMEDSHLRNTVAYIKRKSEEWKKTRLQILNERNHDLGEYRINGASGEQWITLLLDELDRRGLPDVR